MLTSQVRLAAPPRRVPVSLVVINALGGITQIGWAVFGFGMLFFWLFATNADTSFLTFRGDIVRVPGQVQAVEDTHAKENKQLVKKNRYEYSVAGEWMKGTSYSTGWSPSVGDTVTVEYVRSNPLKSRIVGMRQKLFGAGALVVVIFPLIGAAILVGSMLYGIKRADLLRSGVLAMGTLKQKTATNTTVNKRTVYKLQFEFTARDGTRQHCSVNTSFPERLQDEAQEPLLYDPNKPSRAYLLDEVPSRPRIDDLGEMEARPAAAMALLILPALVIAANAFAILVAMKMD